MMSLRIAESSLSGKGLFATRPISKGVFFEEEPFAFATDHRANDDDPLLYTPVWRLVDMLARTPKLARARDWLASGELQQLPHAALSWDHLDYAAGLYVMAMRGLSSSYVYKLYAVVASVNLRCHDGSMALYYTLSYLNHACEPNCHVIAEGGSTAARLRAVRDIAEGEEVTISFVAPSPADAQCADVALSQWAVMELYGFQCRCPAHPNVP